jgi:hypothetical protein
MLPRCCAAQTFQADGRPGIAGPVAEGGDAAAIFVHQVFKIVKRAAPGLEALQQFAARRLALVGMAEHDVAVGEGRAILGQFLQAEDDRVGGGLGPKVFGRDLAACRDVAVDRDGADRGFFDRHADAGLDQRGGTFGRDPHAFLVRPLFGPHPEMGHGRLPPV